MRWIDVHTHINMLEMSADEALSAAAARDVKHMITIGTCPDDWPAVLGLAQKYFPKVACTLGVHPHEAELFTPEAAQFIRENGARKEVVAVGETGLDYYYDNAPRSKQQEVFRAQLGLAEELGLPVEIHTRDAEPDTMQIIGEFKGRVRGLLHCFTGTWEMAKAGLDCGYHVSISGVVTFKNAEALRDVVRKVPLDSLHVETDAPFLAPVPHRGKKNQPAWVTETAKVVADLKGVTLEQLSEHTLRNAKSLFPKLHLDN
jgi:TatD DNase family protein